MPALGESVTEGTVTRWLKAEGDEVAVDEPLLEVSTDKVDTEIPSPVAGTLTKILVQRGRHGAGRRRPGRHRRQSGGGSAAPQPSRRPRPDAQARAGRPPAPGEAAGPGPEAPQEQRRRPHARRPRTPAARSSAAGPAAAPAAAPPGGAAGRVAARRRLGLRHPAGAQARRREQCRPRSLKGTGVGGRIRKQDVLDAAEAAKAAAAAAPARAGRPRLRRPRGAAEPPAVSPKRGTTEKMTPAAQGHRHSAWSSPCRSPPS